MKNIKFYSLYWNNISKDLLFMQKAVFAHHGFEVQQVHAHLLDHGKWMNDVVANSNHDDLLIFSDIDAIPLTREAVLYSIEAAKDGAVFGLAQCANHTNNKMHLYAGPMYLSFLKSTWEKVGSPSFLADTDFDVAQRLSLYAELNDIAVKKVYPNACIIPKWPLASSGVFGIGTFYENRFFHLFESRNRENIELFNMVATDVINGHSLDYEKYLNHFNESKNKDRSLIKKLFLKNPSHA